MPAQNTMDEVKSLDNLSERLKYAIKIVGVSQANLAREINVKPQTIQYLCSQKAEWSKFTFELAHALGVSVEWLATGKGEMFPKNDPKQYLQSQQIELPILGIQQLKLLSRTGNFPSLDNHKDWALSSSKDIKQGFAVVLKDKAMWPRFDEETLLIFDICRNPKDGSFVLAYIKVLDDVVFRELKLENTQSKLFPFNTKMYKEIDLSQDDRILGVMIEARWRDNV